MEEYLEKIKELLIEYTPNVITALIILIVGLFLINIVIKSSKKIIIVIKSPFVKGFRKIRKSLNPRVLMTKVIGNFRKKIKDFNSFILFILYDIIAFET